MRLWLGPEPPRFERYLVRLLPQEERRASSAGFPPPVYQAQFDITRHNDYCQEELFQSVIESKDVQRIHLISTGGTIEKIYSETSGSVVNLETKIDRYLKQLRLPDAEIDAISVM